MSLPFEPRDEDGPLLTGAGRFCDDDRMPGEAHAVFVRSPHAFAAIRRIDAGEFTPSPDEFTCNGCPALDVVCAGPKLRNPPERIVATV
jgi:carbon-monoxide dehydrogenase large subunit